LICAGFAGQGAALRAILRGRPDFLVAVNLELESVCASAKPAPIAFKPVSRAPTSHEALFIA